MSLPTVDRWLDRYARLGLAGLEESKRGAGACAGAHLRPDTGADARDPTDLFAALNVATGTVLAHCYPQRAGVEFLAFLRKAVKPHRGKEIHVVLDNLSTHDTPEVRAWLQANANVTCHFTPVGRAG